MIDGGSDAGNLFRRWRRLGDVGRLDDKHVTGLLGLGDGRRRHTGCAVDLGRVGVVPLLQRFVLVRAFNGSAMCVVRAFLAVLFEIDKVGIAYLCCEPLTLTARSNDPSERPATY